MFEKFFRKSPESPEMGKEEELNLRERTIAELKKREETWHKDMDAKEPSKITDEERRKNSNEFAAIWNLREQLEGTEDVTEATYSMKGKLLKEKIEKVKGEKIPSVIQKIEGYITRNQEEIDKIKESGEQPSPRLIDGLEIQKIKRELLREITGL